MSCNHRHVVIHRNDVEEHTVEEGKPEVCCSCGPGLVCPVCDWHTIYHGCMVMAPADLVDAHAVRPPTAPLN